MGQSSKHPKISSGDIMKLKEDIGGDIGRVITRPTNQRTDANLYPLERQLAKAR